MEDSRFQAAVDSYRDCGNEKAALYHAGYSIQETEDILESEAWIKATEIVRSEPFSDALFRFRGLVNSKNEAIALRAAEVLLTIYQPRRDIARLEPAGDGRFKTNAPSVQS